MKQMYLKCFLLCSILFSNTVPEFGLAAYAQLKPLKYGKLDRTDLLNNIKVVETDKLKIAAITQKLEEARNKNDELAITYHRKRLSQQKEILKKNIKKMKNEENAFIRMKNDQIAMLKEEVEKSKELYEQIRVTIRKDLADKKDWSLQKDVNELMEAQKVLKEQETQLAMETSDLRTTIAATRNEWKRVNINATDTADSEETRLHPKNLSAR